MARLMMLAAGLAFLGLAAGRAEEKKPMGGKVFELRTYYVHPGRMPALEKRFKDHTIGLLGKYGMKLVGFWKPADPKQAEEVLVYLVEHSSRETADKSWADFRKDADWIAARDASEKDGKIVMKVDVQWWNATPYSAIK
ncbi:MAG: NIPSNAP family protein [Planctomycetes bacterium]|nr:NIPSNAP family protein [Planctomycetota bacterium]